MTQGEDTNRRSGGAGPKETTAPLGQGHPAARPFPWERLETFDAEHVEALRRLSRLLPRRGAPDESLASVAALLESHTDLEHDIRYQGLRLWSDMEQPPSFGDAFVTQLRLPPNPDVGAVVVDMSLADRWLESLLGAQPESRRLGDVDQREFGLLTFLLLAVLDRLKEWGAPPVVVPSEPPVREILTNDLEESSRLVELHFGVRCDERPHLVRLYLPMELLGHAGLESDPLRSGRNREELLGSPVAGLEVQCPTVIGQTVLDGMVANGLEAGDVVLFDRDGWRGTQLEEGASNGGRLYLDRFARRRYLPVGVGATSAGTWHIALTSTTPRTATEVHMADDAPETSEDAATPESPGDDEGATELMEAPEMTLEVEIGSARMTVRDLSDLQAGEVIELDREVGDPVDLVVNGTKIGEGELVQIEGQLGVRIEQIDN